MEEDHGLEVIVLVLTLRTSQTGGQRTEEDPGGREEISLLELVISLQSAWLYVLIIRILWGMFAFLGFMFGL